MNKIALVTGATRGIGFATSKKLASLGWHVLGIARHMIPDFPGELFLADLSDPEQTQEVIKKIRRKYVISALVNNVGDAHSASSGETTLLDLQADYNINLRTTVQITQGFIKDMKKQKWGRIINTSSIGSFGMPFFASYAASKSALIGATRTWALELAPFNITVNAIAPGPTDTGLLRRFMPKGDPKEAFLIKAIPLKRIAKPEEIAALTAFLLSQDAGYITGQVILIDGGADLPNIVGEIS